MGNPELNCDPLLYSLVFGESVLNDAVAIVLFKVTYIHTYIQYIHACMHTYILTKTSNDFT